MLWFKNNSGDSSNVNVYEEDGNTNIDNGGDNVNVSDNVDSDVLSFLGFEFNKLFGYTYEVDGIDLNVYNNNFFVLVNVFTGSFNNFRDTSVVDTVKTELTRLSCWKCWN